MSEISEKEIKAMTKEQNYMRGYRDGKSDILGKIRAEIKRGKTGLDIEFNGGIDYAISIIDKYKTKSEK